MTTLLAIFIRVILPVFVIVTVGYVAGRTLYFDQRSLSRVGLYILVPCMAFTTMARTTLSAAEFGQIVLFYLLSVLALWGIAAWVARWLNLDSGATSAFQIGILFTNCVNVGFPIVLLAYGQAALDRALVYSLTMQVVLQSLGVYLAARGKVGVREAWRRIWQMPGLYAMLAGIIVNAASVSIPASIYDPLKLVGDSLVPFLLLVLGMQLASVSLRGYWRVASVGTIIRLGVAAGVSIVLADWMGMQGVTRQTAILENSMPTAIFGVALAQEFDTVPELTTTIIFLSTLASMFTLTVLIAVI